MSERVAVIEDVIEQGVVPFWYDHSQRRFTVGSNVVPLRRAGGYNIAREVTADDRIEDVSEWEQVPLTYGVYSEPIALTVLSKMLASHKDIRKLQQEAAQVMSEVHEELAFPLPPALISTPIYDRYGHRHMDFTIITHDSLHVTDYSLINRESQQHGVFEYGFNNANDYPAARPTLLSGLGHLAFLAME